MMLSRSFRCLSIILGLVVNIVYAQSPVYLVKNNDLYDITDNIHFYQSSKNEKILTIIDKMKKNKFESDHQRLISVGKQDGATWLLFKLVSQQASPGRWVVELPNPHISQVQFHYITGSDTIHYPETGDDYIFYKRGIRHQKYLFPVDINPGDTAWCAMMIAKPGEYMPVMALRLHREYSFFAYDYQEQARNNALLALLMFNFFITLLFVIQFRQPVFWWYMFLLAVNALYVLSVSGLGFRYVWPMFPAFNGWARALYLAFLPGVFFSFACAYFGDISGWMRQVRVGLGVLGILILGYAAVDSIDSPRTESMPFLVLSTLGLALMIVATVAVNYQGFRSGSARDAYWFLGAYSFMLVAIIINLLAYYGQLRSRTATTIFLGSIVAELTVLTVRVGLQGYFLQRKALELQIVLERERREAMQRLVDSMDRMNQHVGDMLHDEIGAMLALIRLNAEQLGYARALPLTEWQERYFQTLAFIDKTVEEVRQYAHRLSALPVGRLGLLTSIRDQLADINSSGGVQFEFVGLGNDQMLPPNLSVNAYRILLGLITNILRHAKANHALIQIIVREDGLSLLAEDDGLGFDTGQLAQGGFEMILNRVQAFNGTLSVESAPGKGTVVAIEIPLGEKTE